MPTIQVYGIDHSRAPIEVREQLSFNGEELLELLPLLITPAALRIDNTTQVHEAMLLSTCNRTEVYLVTDGIGGPYPLEPLRKYRPEAQLMDNVCLRYHLHGPEAVSHLFSVAASLRSQVPGDTQISTQVSTAARIARSAGTLGPLLEQAVAAALRSAKRVRRETGLMAGGSGTGPAVLRCLRRFRQPDPRTDHPMRVLLLGAGIMAEEVATHLLRSRTTSIRTRPLRHGSAIEPAGVTFAGVWARDRKKAKSFGEMFGVRPLTPRGAMLALADVDVVIGACGGRVGMLSERQLSPILEKRTKPLLVVDLGVPRNLDPLMAERDGVEPIFLDQVHELMRDHMMQRGAALEKAAAIVAEEVSQFEQWLCRFPLRPLRAEMYNSLETILARWRSSQPKAVQHLRVTLHRSLDQAFRGIDFGAANVAPTNQ